MSRKVLVAGDGGALFKGAVRIRLTRSALRIGCENLGYCPREDCRDALEEERRYEVYLKNRGFDVVSVEDGHATVRLTTPPREPSLHDDLVAAGCQLDHHESDLYVKDCPAARAAIARHGACFHPFRSQTDGMSEWLDVPFAWAPFWEKKDR